MNPGAVKHVDVTFCLLQSNRKQMTTNSKEEAQVILHY